MLSLLLLLLLLLRLLRLLLVLELLLLLLLLLLVLLVLVISQGSLTSQRRLDSPLNRATPQRRSGRQWRVVVAVAVKRSQRRVPWRHR